MSRLESEESTNQNQKWKMEEYNIKKSERTDVDDISLYEFPLVRYSMTYDFVDRPDGYPLVQTSV